MLETQTKIRAITFALCWKIEVFYEWDTGKRLKSNIMEALPPCLNISAQVHACYV